MATDTPVPMEPSDLSECLTASKADLRRLYEAIQASLALQQAATAAELNRMLSVLLTQHGATNAELTYLRERVDLIYRLVRVPVRVFWRVGTPEPE